MAITPAVLQPGVVLATAASAMYTAPANVHAVVKRGVFTNISAGALTVTVTVTRSGGPAVTIISSQPIGANATYTAPELANLVLNAGDAINAQASAAAGVNCFISGFTL